MKHHLFSFSLRAQLSPGESVIPHFPDITSSVPLTAEDPFRAPVFRDGVETLCSATDCALTGPDWSIVLPTSTCRHLFFKFLSSLLERSSSTVVHHLLERLSPTAVHHLLPNGLLVFFSIVHHPLSYIVFSNDYHIRAYITYYRVVFSFLLPTRLSLCFSLGLMAFPPVSDSDRVSLTLEGEFPRVLLFNEVNLSGL